jgi:hypothetical protein
VPVAEVREALRRQFGRWGLPGGLRLDNGVPWGNWNDLPTPLALWLVGLGVPPHFNDPGRPTQNPKIERAQGTGQRWAEPGRCASVAELQANLDEADRIHREEYVTPPAVASRLELFPELRHSGRRYTRAGERRAWSLAAVEAHLSAYVAVRRVSATRHATVYDRGRYVGQQHAGSYVQVQYDPQRHGWLIADGEGRELRRHPAPEITREQIAKLTFRKQMRK